MLGTGNLVTVGWALRVLITISGVLKDRADDFRQFRIFGLQNTLLNEFQWARPTGQLPVERVRKPVLLQLYLLAL